MKIDDEKKKTDGAGEPIAVDDVNTIEDGTYKGEIFDVKKRSNKGYTYTDIHFILDKTKNKIKAGFPSDKKITKNSMFYKFLDKSQYNLKVGEKIYIKDLKNHLLEKKVKFLVYTDENGWPKIKRDSINFLD
jgi:hypothetical protein